MRTSTPLPEPPGGNVETDVYHPTTGMVNKQNTCYMISILQVSFDMFSLLLLPGGPRASYFVALDNASGGSARRGAEWSEEAPLHSPSSLGAQGPEGLPATSKYGARRLPGM